MHEALLAAFTGPEAWQLYPEVDASLRELRRRGFALAVLSDSDPRLHAILAALGLRGRFDYVGCSYELGAAKPDPRAFGAVRAQFGVRPEQMVHVGDDPGRDFWGPVGSGYHGLLVDRAGGAAPSGIPPERVVPDLAALPRMLVLDDG